MCVCVWRGVIHVCARTRARVCVRAPAHVCACMRIAAVVVSAVVFVAATVLHVLLQ